MSNSYMYPSDGIFNSHWITSMDSLSCIYFFRQMHIRLNMCLIISTLKYLQLRPRNVRVGSCLRLWWRNIWRKITSNVLKTSWRHARELSYTPVSEDNSLHRLVMRKFLSGMQEKWFSRIFYMVLPSLKNSCLLLLWECKAQKCSAYGLKSCALTRYTPLSLSLMKKYYLRKK